MFLLEKKKLENFERNGKKIIVNCGKKIEKIREKQSEQSSVNRNDKLIRVINL